MSIRLRLSLLYTAILAVTLLLFGAALYFIQSRNTLDALKNDLTLSGENMAASLAWRFTHPPRIVIQSEIQPEMPLPLPLTFEIFSPDQAFQRLREREIVRVLDVNGNLIASPFGKNEDALPLSPTGLQALSQGSVVWQTAVSQDASTVEMGRLLIYNRPILLDGEVIAIVQVARSLDERDRSLSSLGMTLLIASLLTLLVAFGVGWLFSGYVLRPIQRITQTAQAIGQESDFTRRVDYHGPNDEIGQLATTFNAMLARLHEAYQRVSQALSLQRQFVADVSHELRTPLTTVRGNLELLRREALPPPTEQADILNDLVSESDRLIRLVNDLLLLARADAGRSLLYEPVALQPLVEEACRQAQQLDCQRQITASVPEVSVLGDRDALKQVLLILLDNAIKYSKGTIEVIGEDQGRKVLLAVRDEGPGIDPAELQRVFDRFYRSEVSLEVPGFGLGLPIARSLVEDQGGEISLQNLPGVGVSVEVLLTKN